jgi:curved DNA-binding protein CbpA
MEEPDMPDYYESLGVGPQSTVQVIKKAFRCLAKLHHPDKQAPGICADAGKFRRASSLFIVNVKTYIRRLSYHFLQVREAQEALCDETRRREYDMIYPFLRLQWVQYRKEKDAQQAREELRNAEKERIRRRAAEDAAKREAEAERVRKLAEEERLAAQRAEREKLRAQREREAEERSREVARRAREQQERKARERLQKDQEKKAQQEREAKERLQKEKERKAEERSQEAAKKWREQQDKQAKERLLQILIEERQDTIRRNWTTIREQAETRNLKSVAARSPTLNQVESTPAKCIHPQVGWPRKNGPSNCYFCGKNCAKYSFRCPSCNVAACVPCKKQHCPY